MCNDKYILLMIFYSKETNGSHRFIRICNVLSVYFQNNDGFTSRYKQILMTVIILLADCNV